MNVEGDKNMQDLYPMTAGFNVPIGNRVTKSSSLKKPPICMKGIEGT